MGAKQKKKRSRKKYGYYVKRECPQSDFTRKAFK